MAQTVCFPSSTEMCYIGHVQRLVGINHGVPQPATMIQACCGETV